MNTHTKGPWTEWRRGEESIYLMARPDDVSFCIGRIFNENSEGEANARLIAAAPDLLEMLSVAIYEAERGRLIMAEANKEMGFDEPKKLDWVVRAEAAIAKATLTPTPQ